MLKFYLTTQESYIIFQALQKILNSNNIDIDETIQIINRENSFHKKDFIDIYKRYFIFNNIHSLPISIPRMESDYMNGVGLHTDIYSTNRIGLHDNNVQINIVEEFSINENVYFIKFNKELFTYLSNEDISFIKQIKFNYRYVASLKLIQLNKEILNFEDLKYIDNNNYILIENLKKEKDNIKVNHKLKHLEKTIFELENKDIEDYIQLLKNLKNEFNFLFKVETLDTIKIKFKKNQENNSNLLTECNKQSIACKKNQYNLLIKEEIIKRIKDNLKTKEINFYKKNGK